MKRVLRWFGITFVVLVVLVAAFLATTWAVANNRIDRTYEVAVPAVEIPTDAASIAEGGRLAASRACLDCHGADLGGNMLVDDPLLGRLWGTNLTGGVGGVGAEYGTEDYARAVWFGLKPDGSPLAHMPSSEYHEALDPAHLGKIIAYIRSVPAVDRETPSFRLGPVGWSLFALGQLPLLHIEMIDTSEPPPAVTPVEISAEYGATIGILCTGCHGADLAGMTNPTGSVAPNLTPHPTGLEGWTLADFERVFRAGVRPDGTAIADTMPWQNLGQMTDTELEALWVYLSGLDPRPSNVEN